MRKKISLLGLFVASLTIGVAATSVLPLSAQEAPPPIAVEILSDRSVFTDDIDMKITYALYGNTPQTLDIKDPSRTVVARITVQPGAEFPWHTHPGPIIVNVSEGKLIYVQAKDCIKRPYKEGTAFVDPGRGNVHTAYNGYHGETVLIATFFEVPASGPLTITEGIHAPADCHVLSSDGGGAH
jgi:quercetin dioxygenase-like cupin family protein